MKWWGWLVAGVAASLIFVALLPLLQGLDVLVLSKTNTGNVLLGGLVIIWATCIAAPLVLKAIKDAKAARAAKGDK